MKKNFKTDRNDSISALVELMQHYKNAAVTIYSDGSYYVEDDNSKFIIEGDTENMIQDIADNIIERNRPFEYLEDVEYVGKRYKFIKYIKGEYNCILAYENGILYPKVKDVKRIKN